MTLAALTKLIQPPAEPVYSGSRKEWSAFQNKTGLEFPNDYYEVATTYGSGRFLEGEFKVANAAEPQQKS